jgi:glycosyltransferase involved in cell wall biosynthesis
VFRGTGIQMKLVQALSAGVATVATSMAAARAGVRDGVHVRTADDAPGWIAATRALLTDRQAAARLAEAGRWWAVANHGSAAVGRQLNVAYSALTGAEVVARPARTY